MRASVILLGVVGIVTSAAAENRGPSGPSPIISALPPLVNELVAPPVMAVAQATNTTVKSDMTLSACEPVQTPDNPNGQLGGGVSPASTLESYWYDKYNEVLTIKDARVTVLQGPAHGVVEAGNFVSELGPYFEYAPNPGFLGEDKITFLVELGDKHVKVVITLIVVENSVDQGDSPCFRGAKRIGSTDMPTLTTDLATWISTTQLDSLFSGNASLNFADLTGVAVGQTVGSTITLDTAAGYYRFIAQGEGDK